MNVEELNKDLEELQRLHSGATRPRVQTCLSSEIQRVKKEIANRQKPAVAAEAPAATSVLPTTKISTYAWDQSDQYLKLYVSIPGAAPGQDNHMRFDVDAKSVELRANDIAGKNYHFTVKGLLNPVVPDGSHFKVKKEQILIMLKKKDTGNNWESVTITEQQNKDKRKPKMDEHEDPNSSMMTLMQQMYDDGDDEMKRTIKKAWFEAQEKKKGLGGDGPDM